MDLTNCLLKLPLSSSIEYFTQESRKTARAILTGQDSRKAVIVGPCSIHSINGALSYAQKIKDLQEKVGDHLFLVMRAFIEKPRTQKGWKGFMYDPDLSDSCDVDKGIFLSRKLLLELCEMEVPIAMEFLDINASIFFQDLVTWGFIGARTCTSQPHRQLASLLPMPVGIKNSVDGHIDHAIHGVQNARESHRFLHVGSQANLNVVESRGNPYTHIVLRGGRSGPNFHNLDSVKKQLQLAGLATKIMIDCAHGNSSKSLEAQGRVFKEVGASMVQDSDLFGIMLESNLKAGSQKQRPFSEEVSITDPCLGWEETQQLILELYQELSKSGASSNVSFSTSRSSSLVGSSSS